MARQTVRKCLADAEAPRDRLTEARLAPAIAAVKEIIDTWLAEDANRPKQRTPPAAFLYDSWMSTISGGRAHRAAICSGGPAACRYPDVQQELVVPDPIIAIAILDCSCNSHIINIRGDRYRLV